MNKQIILSVFVMLSVCMVQAQQPSDKWHNVQQQVLAHYQNDKCYSAYIMRACGIHVGIDFTPQWPFRSSGHYWNVLLDNSGKIVPFMGGESNPGYPCKAGYTIAGVYRKIRISTTEPFCFKSENNSFSKLFVISV